MLAVAVPDQPSSFSEQKLADNAPVAPRRRFESNPNETRTFTSFSVVVVIGCRFGNFSL
jgi:hypothetical protein